MNSFEAELQMDFKNKLENPHVISPKQVNISILKRGINNNEFKFDYISRDNSEMIDDLGLTIARVVEKIPGGVLIFFPSYK
jgi:Rad3-related DNA helicase